MSLAGRGALLDDVAVRPAHYLVDGALVGIVATCDACAVPDRLERNRREGRLVVRYVTSNRSAQKLFRVTDGCNDHGLMIGKGLLDWLVGQKLAPRPAFRVLHEV